MALKLEIRADVGDVGGLEKLTKHLENLQKVSERGNLGKLATSLDTLRTSVANLSSTPTIGGVKLKNLRDFFTVLNSAPTTMPDLSGLKEGLSPITNLKISKTNVKNLENLFAVANKAKVNPEVGRLGDSLVKFSNVKISKSLGKNLKSLVDGVKGINGDFAPKLDKLAKAFIPLSKLPKSNLGSYINPLSKLGKAIQDINATKLTEIDEALKKVKALIKQVEKLGGIKISGTSGAGNAGNAKGGISGFFADPGVGAVARITAVGWALSKLNNQIKSITEVSNEYVENLNLFTVSMGEFASEAGRYADQVQNVLGIDKSQWIRNQGLFKQILSGFGTEEETAYRYSKVLTQLTYDLASFYDISTTLAHRRLASGIAGELEPLRRLGYALDQATLQQIAYRNGINLLVHEMTQAEKAQLRMVAIYEQSANAMGDLSRTLITPANAMRIFEMQIHRLKRALANGLIPILMAVIPYLQAVVEVLIMGANALASFLGFELPRIQYSKKDFASSGVPELAEGIDNVAKKTGKATEKAKEFKAFLAGFDQMHIIPEPPKPSSGAGGVGGAGDLGLGGPRFNLDVGDYDFIGAASSRVSAIKDKILGFIKKIKDFLAPLKGMFTGFFKTILGAMGFAKIAEWLGKIIGLNDLWIAKLKSFGAIIGATAFGYKTAYEAAKKFYEGNISGLEFGLTLLGQWTAQFGAITWAFKKLGVPTPVALGLSAVLTTLTTIYGVLEGINEARMDKVKAQLQGGLRLELEDIQRIVTGLFTTEYTLKLRVVDEANRAVKEAGDNLAKSLYDLQSMNLTLRLDINTISLDEIIAVVEQAIGDTEAYIKANKDRTTLTIDLLFGDSPAGQSIKDLASGGVLGSLETDLMNLKSRWLEIMSSDWSETEKEAAAKKIAIEVQDVMQKVEAYNRELEHKTQMYKIKSELVTELSMKVDPSTIDWESLKQAVEAVNEEADKLVDQVMESASALQAKLDIDFTAGKINDQQFKQAILAIEREKQEQAITVRVQPMIELMGTFDKEFGKLLEADLSSSVKDLDFTELAEELKTKTKSVITAGFLGFVGGETVTTFSTKIRTGVREVLEVYAKELDTTVGMMKTYHKEKFTNMYEEAVDEIKVGLEKVASAGGSLNAETAKFFEEAVATAVVGGERWAEEVIFGIALARRPDWVEALSELTAEGKKIPENIRLGILSQLGPLKEAIMTQFSTEGAIPQEIKSAMESLGVNVPAWYAEKLNSNLDKVKQATKGVGETIDDEIKASSNPIREATMNLAQTQIDSYADLMKQDQMPVATREQLTKVKSEVETHGANLAQATGEVGGDVVREFVEHLDSDVITTAVSDQFGEVQGVIDSDGPAITRAFGNLGRGMGNSLIDEFRNTDLTGKISIILESIINPLGTIKRLWRDVTNTTPDFTNKTTTSSKRSSPSNRWRGGSAGRFAQYAGGGFPEYGQIFIAREAGPELLGSLGGKTAVANNLQIIQGIAMGVHTATVSAMNKFGEHLAKTLANTQAGGYNAIAHNEGGANDNRVTRDDFNYGLGVLANAIVAAIKESGDTVVEVDGESLARVANRHSRRQAIMEV